MQKRKLIILIWSLLAVIVLTTITISLINYKKVEGVNINQNSDAPILAYEALDKIVEDSASYLLKICQIGSTSQEIASKSECFEIGCNGNQYIAYTQRDGEFLKDNVNIRDIYADKLMTIKDTSYFELAHDQNALYYTNEEYPDSLFVDEFDSQAKITNEKKLTVSDSVFQEYNFSSGIGLFMKNFRSDQESAFEDDSVNPYDYNWGDIYLCTGEGLVSKIAEKAFCSGVRQSIGNDGSVVFIKDCDEKSETGDLYLKTFNDSPRLIKANSTNDFAISPDGQLVAAIIQEANNNKTLFCQFNGSEVKEIDNVITFKISQDSSTLVYLVNTEDANRKELYSMKGDLQPVLLTDNAIGLQEVSEDGNTVSYLTNYDEDSRSGDLYIVKVGEEVLLVDSGVYMSSITAYSGMTTINMRDDGQYIAYLKNMHDDRFYGDLYIAKIGEQAQMIEQNVSTGFDFFG